MQGTVVVSPLTGERFLLLRKGNGSLTLSQEAVENLSQAYSLAAMFSVQSQLLRFRVLLDVFTEIVGTRDGQCRNCFVFHSKDPPMVITFPEYSAIVGPLRRALLGIGCEGKGNREKLQESENCKTQRIEKDKGCLLVRNQSGEVVLTKEAVDSLLSAHEHAAAFAEPGSNLAFALRLDAWTKITGIINEGEGEKRNFFLFHDHRPRMTVNFAEYSDIVVRLRNELVSKCRGSAKAIGYELKEREISERQQVLEAWIELSPSKGEYYLVLRKGKQRLALSREAVTKLFNVKHLAESFASKSSYMPFVLELNAYTTVIGSRRANEEKYFAFVAEAPLMVLTVEEYLTIVGPLKKWLFGWWRAPALSVKKGHLSQETYRKAGNVGGKTNGF